MMIINPKNKKKMKKMIAFIEVCAFVIGALGGIGYAVYGGSWPIAVAIVIMAVMAWPTFKGAYKQLAE